MWIYIASAAASTSGINEAYLITAILSAAIVVIGGLFGLIRAIWKTANVMRDLSVAVKDLTKRFDDMIVSVDGRFDKLSNRVLELEQHMGKDYGRNNADRAGQ